MRILLHPIFGRAGILPALGQPEDGYPTLLIPIPEHVSCHWSNQISGRFTGNQWREYRSSILNETHEHLNWVPSGSLGRVKTAAIPAWWWARQLLPHWPAPPYKRMTPPQIQWRMASSYTPSLDTVYGPAANIFCGASLAS